MPSPRQLPGVENLPSIAPWGSGAALPSVREEISGCFRMFVV